MTYTNSLIKDTAMDVVAAVVEAEVIEELAIIPHQAIKALPKMLQISVDSAS